MPLSLLANNPVLSTVTKEQLDRIDKGEWYHSIELPNGNVIPGIITLDALRGRLSAFELPDDLRGKRVLDVGTATGWCSFEMERRGAEVIAVDCVEYDDFRVAHRLLNSKVDYRVLDVDELTQEELGQFDIILFFGVLYHLREPLLGLERILPLARDTVLVESFVCDARLSERERAANGSYMEFYEIDQLGGQIDNWVGPNVNCLLAFCRTAGFVGVELKYIQDNRAGVVCRRRWESLPGTPTEAAPIIGSAVNNRSGENVFHTGKDEYICLYFRSGRQLVRENLRVEIDGYGVPVLTLTSNGTDGWQVNLRTPVDLQAGAHSIRLRLVDSPFSERVAFYCGERPPKPKSDAQPATGSPNLYRVSSGLSNSREFFGRRSEYLACWFRVDAGRLEREDVIIELGEHQLAPSFLGWAAGDGWQANVKLPSSLNTGVYPVRVRLCNGSTSNPMEVTFGADPAQSPA